MWSSGKKETRLPTSLDPKEPQSKEVPMLPIAGGAPTEGESGDKVDLMVTMMTTSAFLADHFDCPVVVFSPFGPFPDVMPGTGITFNPSLKPFHRGLFIEPLTFIERVLNNIQYR